MKSTLQTLAVLALLSLVAAQSDAEGAAEDASGDAEGAAEDASGEVGEAGETAESFLDSAQELQDKIGQLSSLLENRGDEIDPELKERLAGLQNSLKGLGMDTLSLGGDAAQTPSMSTKELRDFMAGCVSMSMRRAGLKAPTTTGSMRRLATDGFTKEQGKDIALVKLIAVCITELSDTELDLYKSGKLTQVSKEMEDKSKTSAAADIVLSIDDQIWKELAGIAKSVVGAQGGEDPRKDTFSSNLGLLALVPVIGAVAFLAKKFLDMQSEAGAKTSGKKSKKQK